MDMNSLPDEKSEIDGPMTLRALLASQTGLKFFKEFLKTRCAAATQPPKPSLLHKSIRGLLL
jgi:hypothetical protein